MIEIDPKKPFDIYESVRDYADMVRFRARCKREGKRGMMSHMFAQYHVDEHGAYVDGNIPSIETEMMSLFEELNA